MKFILFNGGVKWYYDLCPQENLPIRTMQLQAQQLTLLEDSPFSPVSADTFCYAPAAAHERNLGNLYVVAELSSEKSRKENTQLLSDLVQQIKGGFYRKTNTTALAALRFALKKANQFLANQNSINLSTKIIVAALKDTGGEGRCEFHLAKTGPSTALILRENNLNFVFSAPRVSPGAPYPRTANQFETIISSEIWPDDIILLATNQIHKLSNDKLKKHLAAGRLIAALKTNRAGLKNLALVTLRREVRGEVQPSKEVAVKEVRPPEEVEPHKRKIKIAILLIAVVIVSAGGIIAVLKIKKETAIKKKEAEVIIKEVEELKEKTSALLGLNNETESAELTNLALEKLRRLEELGFFKTSRVTLTEEFAKISRGLKQIEPVNNISAVLDLTGNTADFEPQGLSLGKNKIIVYGPAGFYKYDLNLRVGEFDLSTKDGVLLAAMENPKKPGEFWLLKQDLLIATAAIKGIPTSTELARSEKSQFKEMSLYGDALYLLDQDSLIYKLDLETATSSDPNTGLTLWFKPEKNDLLTTHYSLTHMAIDGAVYGLTDQHQLVKMLNGDIQNQTDLTETVDQIATEPDFNNIYLLSRAESMILVMDKRERIIKKRLSRSDLGEAKSFAVDSRERTIYFLKDKTVYSFELAF